MRKKQEERIKTELEKRLEAKAAAEETESQAAQASPAEPKRPDEPGVNIELLLAERDELKDQVLRCWAELENFRKRTAREVERIRRTATESLVRDLLPVLDHLELAVHHGDDSPASLAEGVEMVLKQFREVLTRHGLEEIPAEHLPFDPNVHEAVMEREHGDLPTHTVIEAFQKGYMLGGQVLRPTKVVVSAPGTGPGPLD